MIRTAAAPHCRRVRIATFYARRTPAATVRRTRRQHTASPSVRRLRHSGSMRPIPEQASLKCTLPAFHPNLQPEQNNLPDVSALQHRQMLANSLSLTNLSSAAHQQHRPQQQHASFGFQPPNQLEQRHQQDEYGVVDDLALANLQQVRSLIDPPTQPDIIHSLENTIGNTAAANGAITHGRIANIAGLPAASSSVSSPRHPPTAPPQHLKTSAGQAFPHIHQPQPASRLKPDAIHFSQSQNHFRNQYNRYHGPATEQQPSDRIQYQSMYQIPRSSSHSHIGNQPASNPTMQTKSFAPTHRLPSRAHPPPAYSSQLPHRRGTRATTSRSTIPSLSLHPP